MQSNIMNYKATSVDDYINQIPKERKEPVNKLRKVILENLPNGFEEGINYNMIGYYVPHSKYPNGYHCDPKLPLPFMNVASQKNSINLYHLVNKHVNLSSIQIPLISFF